MRLSVVGTSGISVLGVPPSRVGGRGVTGRLPRSPGGLAAGCDRPLWMKTPALATSAVIAHFIPPYLAGRNFITRWYMAIPQREGSRFPLRCNLGKGRLAGWGGSPSGASFLCVEDEPSICPKVLGRLGRKRAAPPLVTLGGYAESLGSHINTVSDDQTQDTTSNLSICLRADK